MNIGELIRIKRLEKKLSSRQLGEYVGLSAQAILQYERNERQPNIEMLNKLAAVLNVSINELVGTNDNNSKLEPKSLADYSTEELLLELLKRNRK